MPLLHPVLVARHFAYTLHYALVRVSYERRPVATKKHVGWASFRSYELYDHHGDDVPLQALLLNFSGGDMVVDVGANTGACTLTVVTSEPSAQVVVAEPHPGVVDQLWVNVEVNNFDDQVDLLDCGLSETDESRAFHLLSYDELGLSSQDHASTWGVWVVDTASVSVRRLDSFVESGTVLLLDHLKIDAEGFGLNALWGVEMALRKRRLTMYFELHDTHGSYDEAVVKALLRESSYELVPVRESWVCEPRARAEASRST